MKYIFFFIGIVAFVWVAFVPPDGMSKLPAVNVKFEYTRENGQVQMHVEQVKQESAQKTQQEDTATEEEE